MVKLNNYYKQLNLNEKIALMGIISLILLFGSITLQLSFNFYGSLNGNLISLLIFLMTIFSALLYFYFLIKVLKTRDNSLSNRIIMTAYILLATILFIFKNIWFKISFG